MFNHYSDCAGNDFPDNPANTQPEDWMQIGPYAYPGQGNAKQPGTAGRGG